MSLHERFWSKVERGGDAECWPWIAGGAGGYGYVWASGRARRAHVVAWESSNGRPVPAGSEIHHRCRQRRCCNPAHLVALTPKEHHAEHAATHCKHGHEFTPENTHVRPSGSRLCVQCSRERQRNGRPRAGVIRAGFTHCRVGHPYSGENLRIDAKGGRDCRECARFRAQLNRLWRKYA